MKKFESILSVAVISAEMIGNISAGDDQYAEAIELHCNEKEDVCNYGKVVEVSLECSGSGVDGKVKVVFEDEEFDLWAGYDGNEFCDFDNVEIESDKTEVKCETSNHKASLEIDYKEKLCFKEEKDKKNL